MYELGPLGFHLEIFRQSYRHKKTWVTFFPNELTENRFNVVRFLIKRRDRFEVFRGLVSHTIILNKKIPFTIVINVHDSGRKECIRLMLGFIIKAKF